MMPTTWTDRYIDETVRHVPRDKRVSVAADLRRSIATSVDGRRAAGESPAEAERAALIELGDPLRVATTYTGRPLYLIGPMLYPDYIRLLRLLLAVVVPIVASVVFLASAVAGQDAGRAIVGAGGAAVSAAVQVAFWTTVVFAVLERRRSPADTVPQTWELDDLPEPRDPRVGLGETVASVAGLSLLIWFLLWRPGYQPSLDPGGPSIPILDPTLSSFWIPYLVLVLLASIALELTKYHTGRWTISLAAINSALSLAFAIPAVWLLQTDQVLNPEFLAAIQPTIAVTPLGYTVPTLISTIIVVVCALDITDGWWKALRSRQ